MITLSPRNRRRVEFIAQEFREAELVDRAMTIAAQAFTSFIPLVVALASLAPFSSDSMSDALADLLSLPEGSREALSQALPEDPPATAGFGLTSLLLVLIMGTSLSRALGRMYARVWDTYPAGLRSGWRWVATLLGIALTAILIRTLHRWLSPGYLDLAVDVLVSLAANTVLWIWVPWLLLGGRVPMVRLIPGGILSGVSLAIVSVGTRVYLPRSMDLAQTHYGTLGVAFTYISWFFVIAVAVVASAVLGRLFVGSEWGQAHVREPAPGPID